MRIEGVKPTETTLIKDIDGGQVFKHRNGYYLAGQGGRVGKRDCMFLETGKNYQFSDNTGVEVFPEATLYLE